MRFFLCPTINYSATRNDKSLRLILFTAHSLQITDRYFTNNGRLCIYYAVSLFFRCKIAGDWEIQSTSY